MAEGERKPWLRLPGESARAFDAFCRYRDAGPGRSISIVVRAFLSERIPKYAQQKRYRTHPDQKAYAAAVVGAWKKWSKYWQWVGRCRSFDEHIAEKMTAEAEASALRLAQEELDQQEREAKARLTTFRLGRQIYTSIEQRLAKMIREDKALESCTLPQLVAYLTKLAPMLEITSKNERLELTRPVQKMDEKGKAVEQTEATVSELTDDELRERIRAFFAP